MDSASPPSAIERYPEQRLLLKVLAAALVLRVALGSFIDASGFDTDLMQSWTRTLLNVPLSEFYAVAEGPDHLPGDLWFLWAIGHGLELVGFENAPRGPFVASMKLVPAVADTVIGWELFVLVRWFATSRVALIVSAAFAFNPGAIFLTSIWGQWDSLSMAMLLGGALVILKATSPLGSSSRQSGVSEEPQRLLMDPTSSEALPARIHCFALDDGGGETSHRVGHRHTSGGRPDYRPPFRHSERSAESPGEADVWKAGANRMGYRERRLRRRALRAGIHRFAQDDGGGRGPDRRQVVRSGVPGNVLLWPLAVPLLAWAVLIKPPLALVASVFLLHACVWTLRGSSTVRDALARVASAIVASLGIGIATASLILVPFDVGLPGMATRWSVLERARYALDLYPFTTLQAANIWMIRDAHLYRPSDLDGTLLGLTERTWGSLLLGLALAWIAGVVVTRWRVVRVPDVSLDVQLLIWAALAASYAIFMLPTRVHERYFFPVMVLALAVAGLRGGRPPGRGRRRSAGHHRGVPYDRTSSNRDHRTWWLALAISGLFLGSLLIAYTPMANAIRATLFDVPLSVLFRTVAIVNLGVFLATLALPLWWGAGQRSEFAAPG